MLFPPPTYLTSLVAKASGEILTEIQNNYGSNTTAFKFNGIFSSLIQTWNEAFEEFGGVVWSIDEAGNKLLLFDQHKHGYNAMMQLTSEEDINSVKPIKFRPPTELIIAFQYSGDEAEYLEDGTSKLVQDYFGWVVLYKYLDGKLEELFSYECS
jgi:hypothetical protein